MRTTWSERHQNLVPTGGTRTEFDNLILPKGRGASELSNGDLAKILIERNVSGVSHSRGREANLQVYAAFLDKIRKAAADKAVSDWLGKP